LIPPREIGARFVLAGGNAGDPQEDQPNEKKTASARGLQEMSWN
jgi:hypothetical protein